MSPHSKAGGLEEELKNVTNNLKSLEAQSEKVSLGRVFGKITLKLLSAVATGWMFAYYPAWFAVAYSGEKQFCIGFYSNNIKMEGKFHLNNIREVK